MKKRIFIISGGPGFGKTKIIQELGKLGYCTGSECARDIITEQVLIDGEILPWKNIKAFQQEVLNRRIAFYESITGDEIAFADRGIPDQLAFARYRGFKDPGILSESVIKYPYAKLVFLASPWKEIYRIDDVRKESFEDACNMHNTICDVYRELNYEMVEIPHIDANSRAHFIVDYVKKQRF
ncbi:AAA family ATPase [Sunxiuqinia sp. A32]|uniref:AAA family ATPase n=1 Tax=Sunxiuqinia sp. A32 TaxID=3461496 RepID=UPI0040460885